VALPGGEPLCVAAGEHRLAFTIVEKGYPDDGSNVQACR